MFVDLHICMYLCVFSDYSLSFLKFCYCLVLRCVKIFTEEGVSVLGMCFFLLL